MLGTNGRSQGRKGKRTATVIEHLDEAARLDELASMLRGQRPRRNDPQGSRGDAGGRPQTLVIHRKPRGEVLRTPG